MKHLVLAALTSIIASPVLSQADDKPLSAIDWLSESVETEPTVAEPPIVGNATPPNITVTPLDQPSKDVVGLLPSNVTGLPRDMWAASDEDTLVTLIMAKQPEMLPAMQDLLKVLLLAEADPPFDAGPDGALFLARVDKLLDLGALQPAQSLIERAEPNTGPLFRRWFDVALLTGTENAACDHMDNNPVVAPTYSARIFCLARNGDWQTAVLTLNTHRVLGDITPQEETLITRFLDPELADGQEPLDPPARISPLVFRMHEAIGERLNTPSLPLAFAHADLGSTTGWKAQLEAAERLARHGAVSENVLQKFYTARTPAASGGIWDRAEAIQRFDTAMQARNPNAIGRALPGAWGAMKEAKTEVAFAKIYGSDLQKLPLRGVATDMAFTIGLLSPDYEGVALAASDRTGADAFLVAIARGVPQEVSVGDPLELAIQAAFNGASPPAELTSLAENGKLGEALLRSIAVFGQGYDGDTTAITDALALMRSVGMEGVARQAALQLMILERSP